MKLLSTELIVLLVAVFLVLGGGLGAALDRATPIWVRESSTSAPAAAANTAMQALKAVPKVVAVPAAKAPAKTAPAPSVKAPVKAAPPAVQTPAPAASVAPKPVYSGPMVYPHSADPGAGKTVALTFDDGPDPSTLMRLPFGSYNAITEQVAGQAGMKMWTWSVDTLDWTHAGVLSQRDTDAIVNLAETEEIKLNHPVILTHNPLKGTPSTVAALPTIIEFFKAHRYIVVAL
jgi:peptidoglycan/xylan/chitin deacetylase (PgdA/CDA1 family)